MRKIENCQRAEVYNKPFEPTDMRYINQTRTAIELKELIDELTEKKFMTTACGNLKYSNLNEKIKSQNTLYPMRLWEYTRVFGICNIQYGMKVLEGGACNSIVFYYKRRKS